MLIVHLLAMHTLICATFSLPPGVRGWLRLLLVAPPVFSVYLLTRTGSYRLYGQFQLMPFITIMSNAPVENVAMFQPHQIADDKTVINLGLLFYFFRVLKIMFLYYPLILNCFI